MSILQSRKATGPATDRSASAANNPLSKVVNEVFGVNSFLWIFKCMIFKYMKNDFFPGVCS